MSTERFIARNVKCNGCVTTIQKNLLALQGVESVEVTLPKKESGGGNSTIEVNGTELSRKIISARLAELNYPVVE
ncbi:Heavy metal transporter [Gammaproteobacteria bacterium]